MLNGNTLVSSIADRFSGRTSQPRSRRRRRNRIEQIERRSWNTPSFEMLEPRVLLNADLMPGQFTLVDSANAGPNDVDMIGLGAGTTALVTAQVSVTDGVGADTVTGITVNTTAAGAGAITVDLVTTGAIGGPINFVTAAGQVLTVRIIGEAFNDEAGGGWDPQGQGDAVGINFVAAGYVAGTHTLDNGFPADDDDLTDDGSWGDINFDGNAVLGGGRIDKSGSVPFASISNIGNITYSGNVNLTSAFVVQTADLNTGSVASFNILGNTTLNAFNMDLSMAEFGAAGGNVNISSGLGQSINVNGAGNLTIDSTNAINNGSTLGSVTLGTINVTSTGGVSVVTGESSNITGAVTTGPINITGTASGDVVIAPSGSGNFNALVNIGAVTISDAATSAVFIGTGSTIYSGGLTLNGLNATSTGLSNGLFVGGEGIVGALSLGLNDYLIDNESDFNILIVDLDGVGPATGGFGSINTGNLIVGPAAVMAIDISFTGGGGAVTFGHLVNYSGDPSADINIVFDADMTGDAVASFTLTGQVYAGDQGGANDPITAGPVVVTDNDGDINLSFFGGVTGAFTVNNIFLGDPGQNDGADMTIIFGTLTNDAGFGSISAGNLVNAGNFSDFNLTSFASGGAVTFGHIVQFATGSHHVNMTFDADGDDMGATTSFTAGDIYAANPGGDPVGYAAQTLNRDADVNISFGGGVGPVSLGDVTMGDAGEFDGADLNFLVTAQMRGIGSFLAGTLFLGGRFSSIIVDTHSTGSIGGITLDDVTLAPLTGGGGNEIRFGHISGATSATDLGDLNLADVSVLGNASLSFLARDIDNVNVSSTWTFGTGLGDVIITADSGDAATQDGAIGTVGGIDWDIVFLDDTGGSILITAADGVGDFTANSVTHQDPADGSIEVFANSDGDMVGSWGNLLIRNPGTAGNLVAWGNSSVMNGISGGNVQIAGGANGSFTATAGAIGDIALAIRHDGTRVTNPLNLAFNTSISNGLTVQATDGIGNLSVGVMADAAAPSQKVTLINAFIDANTNNDGVGTLGDVFVAGNPGFDALTGDFFAAGFGNFHLWSGNANLHIETNVAGAANRLATDSSLGNITIGPLAGDPFGPAIFGGALTGGSIFVDNNMGKLLVRHVNPTVADATLDFVVVGADHVDLMTGVPGGPGGDLGGIEVGGHLDINGALTVGGNVLASSPAIQAGEFVEILDVFVLGNLESILTTGGGLIAPGASFIFLGGLFVGGDLPSIRTPGSGSGDYVEIQGAAVIVGDLDEIYAGDDEIFIDGGSGDSLNVQGGTTGSPIAVFTSLGIDYILAVEGQFDMGVIDFTVWFPFGMGPNSGRPAIRINDVITNGGAGGGTSVDTTQLYIATRLEGTSHLDANNTGALWDVVGFQDLNFDQHDWNLIHVEGDTHTGDWGADSNLFDGSNIGENTLGDVVNLEIFGTIHNAADASHPSGPNPDGMAFYINSLQELSFGGVSHPPLTFDIDENFDGIPQDFEIYEPLSFLEDLVTINIPDGGSITKIFVGPTGEFESITFSDTEGDGVFSTVVINFEMGMITDIWLFGQNIGIEFNTLDPDNPATDSNTNIWYGVDAPNGIMATNPAAFPTDPTDDQAIAFLEFSSAIGNITVLDVDDLSTAADESADGQMVRVGNSISIGYVVNIDSMSDITNNGGLRSYIDDPNDGTGNSSEVPLNGMGVPVYAGLGNVLVQGPLGPIVSSGGVGTITTEDMAGADVNGDGVPDADFAGLVTDGSADAINIQGHVGGEGIIFFTGGSPVFSGVTTGSIVVGDRVVLSAGADMALGGGDDVIGINGTPQFLGAIDVAGNLGDTPGDVDDDLGDGNDAHDGGPDDDQNTPDGVITSGFFGRQDQVSAPFGINVDINVGGALNAAIISGKGILVDPMHDETNDSITGNITASSIFGDIWSGRHITGNITATGLGVSPFFTHGNIGGASFWNTTIDIVATGASAGDISGNILAANDIINIFVDAGIGSGGSFIGNLIAGTSGSGGIFGFNRIHADQDIGRGSTDPLAHTNVISSADSMNWAEIFAGLQTVDATIADPTAVDYLGNPDVVDGGSINSDFAAGVPIGDTVPVGAPGSSFPTGFDSSNLPLFQNENDTIDIDGTISAGSFVDSDGDGDSFNDLDSHLNGTFAAAGSIFVDNIEIDGDAIGNNGVAGGHIFAAGLGFKSLDFPDCNILDIDGGTISGTLFGTFSAGLFVPSDEAGPSPLNPFDLGPLQAGTVLTPGEVSIGDNFTFQVGRWHQSATGTNGADGINLVELLTGTETGVVSGYVPAFSVGATCDIFLNIEVVGLPGLGNISPDPATGDAIDVSIVAFGQIEGQFDGGGVVISNSGDFNIVMSNVDAITSFGADPGNPSAPSTLHPFNSGAAGDNELNITSLGFGTGGLNVDYYLAGFDYFVRTVGNALQAADFWSAFGLGDVQGDLTALDADPTNGYDAGNLTFALIAAGENITSDLYADNDIIARLGNAITDGTPLIPCDGFDGDIIAGASANSSISPFTSANFPGGNITGDIEAGDDIGSLSNPLNLITIAAQGGSQGFGRGNISGDIRSGIRDQIAADSFDLRPGARSDINAFIIAGNELEGDIDAGDVFGPSGRTDSQFRGGIHVGAGPDLNIFTTHDNSPNADIEGDIRTEGDLNVEDIDADCPLGILVADDIDGVIEVGYGPGGGDLLGNVIAEGDIDEIEVWGDLGREGVVSIVAAGGFIHFLGIGDASGIPDEGFNDLRTASQYSDSFGDVYSSVFMGGFDSDFDHTHFFFGGEIQPGATVVINFFGGGLVGSDGQPIDVNGGTVTFISGQGRLIQTEDGLIIIAVSDGGGPLNVETFGIDIFQFIAGDELGRLHVVGGSVEQVIVDDDFDIEALLETDDVEDLLAALEFFTFFTESLPALEPGVPSGFGDDKEPIDARIINVENNIGVEGVSIGAGFNQAMDNFAIFIQGNLIGGEGASITSERASIGNIMIGGALGDETHISAQHSIGDVFVTEGDLDGGNLFTASEGSIGVISVHGNISAHTNVGGSVSPHFTVAQNVGGLISRSGSINTNDGTEDGGEFAVHGSIGLIQASGSITGIFGAETGSIGVDLDAGDKFGLINGAGVYSHLGNIAEAFFLAGGDLGNFTAAVGNIVDSSFIAGGAAGILRAGNDISGVGVQVAGNLAGLHAGDDLFDVTVDVEGNIGSIFAGHNIGGNVDEGETSVNVQAAGSVGPVTALTGEIREDVRILAHDSIGQITASEDIDATFIAETGSIAGVQSDAGDITATLIAGLDIGPVVAVLGNIKGTSERAELATGTIILGVSGVMNAGRDIVSLTAGQDIGNYSLMAQGNIGSLTARLGSVGGGTEEIVNVFQFFNTFQGSTFPVTKAELQEIGKFVVMAGGEIGPISAFKNVNGEFIAGGDILNVTAGTGIGNLATTAEQGTRFTSTDGTVGNLLAKTGNIGTAQVPVVIVANGGVEINPATLDYFTTDLDGVGNIFAEAGNIWVNVTTPASVGSNIVGGTATGGIAAPIGSVVAGLWVGGDVGGVAGKSVTITADSDVNGVIGLIRSQGAEGPTFTRPLQANSTLEIISGGIKYCVSIGGGSGSVTYTDANGVLTFQSIVYNSDGASTSKVEVLTKNLNNTDNPTLAKVRSLTVNGTVHTIDIEGHVDLLTINGSLTGPVAIDGNLLELLITGDLLSTASFSVGGIFGDVTVLGVNNLLETFTIDSKKKSVEPQTLAIPSGGGFTNIFIGKGAARVTANVNGQIAIELLGTSARNLVVVNAGHEMSVEELRAQHNMVKKGQVLRTVKGVTVLNEVDEVGADTDGQANITRITATSTKFKLSGVLIEGDVDLLGVTNGLKNTTIRGSAGVVDGGTVVKGAAISGDVDVLKATKLVSDVNVLGNAAVVSSGLHMKNVFVGGSAIAVTAANMKDVQVVGSVGVSIDANSPTTVGLGGNAFSAATIARLLNIAPSELHRLGNPGPTPHVVLLPDETRTDDDAVVDAEHVFYGGLRANTAVRVSVGGAISDLLITNAGQGTDGLILNTLDDAFLQISGSKTRFTKLNGVIGQVIANLDDVVVI